MQTKKRHNPWIGEVGKVMETQNPPIVPESKRVKKVYPSEGVRVPKSLNTGTDILALGWEIGKGTFSKCFYAHSERTNSVYAIKTQRIKGCSSTTKLRVEREMAIHTYVSRHDAITKLIASYRDRDNLYLQLEICRKGDLNSYVKTHGVLSPEKAWQLMLPLASGIEFIHSKRILHRDLKMANIFLTDNLKPKIGDFGLAYKLPERENRKFGRVGTPAYMAPELCYAPYVSSAASDIWAFGVMWFAVVFGVLPFNSPTSEGTKNLIGKGVFEFPDSPTVPNEFRAVLKRLLSSRSSSRPNASELLAILGKQFFQKSPKSHYPKSGISPERITKIRSMIAETSNMLPRFRELKNPIPHSGSYVTTTTAGSPAKIPYQQQENTTRLPVSTGNMLSTTKKVLSQSPGSGMRPLIANYRV